MSGQCGWKEKGCVCRHVTYWDWGGFEVFITEMRSSVMWKDSHDSSTESMLVVGMSSQEDPLGVLQVAHWRTKLQWTNHRSGVQRGTIKADGILCRNVPPCSLPGGLQKVWSFRRPLQYLHISFKMFVPFDFIIPCLGFCLKKIIRFMFKDVHLVLSKT